MRRVSVSPHSRDPHNAGAPNATAAASTRSSSPIRSARLIDSPSAACASAIMLPDRRARPSSTSTSQRVASASGRAGGDGRERLLEVTDRVLPGALADRPGRGLTRILNGLRGVTERTGRQVVVGELGQAGGGTGRGGVLQRGRDPGMQPRPFHPPGAGAQALVDERVPEPETPARFGRGDQAGRDRRLEVEQQLLRIQARHLLKQLRVELPAGDRGDHEQRLGVVGKPVDPAQQDVTDAARHVEREHVTGGQPPAPVLAADEPDQLGGVEGVAAGAVHERGYDIGIGWPHRQALQQRGDVRRLEGADRHPLGTGVAKQFPQRLAHEGDGLGVAHREQQQRGHPVQVAGEQLQQGKRRFVGGVQIVHDREHGGAGGRLPECGGDGLVRPELADAVVAVAFDVAVEPLARRRHPRPVRQGAQHLAPWPVRGGGRGIRAPAPGGGESGAASHVRRRLRDGGLSRTRLADQDHRTAVTGRGIGEPVAKMGQFRVPADQGGGGGVPLLAGVRRPAGRQAAAPRGPAGRGAARARPARTRPARRRAASPVRDPGRAPRLPAAAAPARAPGPVRRPARRGTAGRRAARRPAGRTGRWRRLAGPSAAPAAGAPRPSPPVRPPPRRACPAPATRRSGPPRQGRAPR